MWCYLFDIVCMVVIDVVEEVFKEIKNFVFVKLMLYLYIVSGFWLGFFVNFCKEYLLFCDDRIMLEDDKVLELECVYFVNKVGLSGGWCGFFFDYEFVDGDCLIFEFVELKWFKVYIFCCEEEYEGGEVEDMNEGEVEVLEKNVVIEKKKVIKGSDKKVFVFVLFDLFKGRKLSIIIFVWKFDFEDGEGSEEKGNEEFLKKVKIEVEKDVDGLIRLLRCKCVKEEDDDSKDVVVF